jgi:hypothetical protein
MVGKLLYDAVVNIKRTEYSNCTFYSSFVFILVEVELNIEWETVPIEAKIATWYWLYVIQDLLCVAAWVCLNVASSSL